MDYREQFNFWLEDDYFDEDILEYLLTQADLDINKRNLATPVSQLYIKEICKDNKISDKELELFETMLRKGLDLKETNGANTNGYEYIKDSSKSGVENIDKLREIVER